MSARVAVGLVGVGRIGVLHARTLLQLDGVSTLTIADADRDRARRVAGDLDVAAAESPSALVERGIDAVVIATATTGHARLLRLAAAAGVPAFCEKPVALDLSTMDDVIAEVERAGIVVQVGFQRRFDHGYRRLREAVASGELGRILVLRAATHDPFPPPEQYLASSGGIFRDLLIHDLDAIRFVSGDDVVEIYADGTHEEIPSLAEYGDVDTAVAVLRLRGGALAIVSGTRHDPLGYDVRLEVFGTLDSLVAGHDGRSPLRSAEPGAEGPPRTPYRDFWERFAPAYRRELDVFVEAVRGGGPSACTLADARAALELAVAADRSRTERRPVGLAMAPPDG